MPEGFVKIAFDLDPDEWHGMPVETVWAEPAQECGENASVLHNSPFFAEGVSYMDVVRGAPIEGYRLFRYVECIRRGEHSTFMVLVPLDRPEFEERWRTLAMLGCRYETRKFRISLGERMLYSIDVRPDVDLEPVLAILKEGERAGAWIYQPGNIGHRAELVVSTRPRRSPADVPSAGPVTRHRATCHRQRQSAA